MHGHGILHQPSPSASDGVLLNFVVAVDPVVVVHWVMVVDQADDDKADNVDRMDDND